MGEHGGLVSDIAGLIIIFSLIGGLLVAVYQQYRAKKKWQEDMRKKKGQRN